MAEKIKIPTTNYFDTFIEVAEDTKAISGTKPTSKGDVGCFHISRLKYCLDTSKEWLQKQLMKNKK